MKSGDLISSSRGAGHPNRPEAGVGFRVGDVTGADGEANALVGRLVVEALVSNASSSGPPRSRGMYFEM